MVAKNTWTGTTVGTSTEFLHFTSSTSSNSTSAEYEFPEWADEGRIVIDRDDNEWLVVGQYIENNKGILQLENEELGLEAEAKIEEVEEFW